jgi:hypothetical protein
LTPSKIDIINRRRVFDFGEILVERLPGGEKLQHGRSPNRLDNQAVSFFVEESFVAR